MNIVIASGKGGTGKTTFSVNLAYALAERGDTVRLLDCDVEEPNDHLFIQPEFTERMPVEVMKPVWDEQTCSACGECAEACHYNAIAMVKETVLIFNELCHSCGACSYVCPEKALTEAGIAIGYVEAAPRNEPFYFAHGILNIAEALAPIVVKSVKKRIAPGVINILDASPGTACPVVEAVTGADVAVLVTEPTPFGLNDLKLAVGLTLGRKVPTGIVINRSAGTDDIIMEYADKTKIPILGRIPYKRTYAEAYSKGNILTHLFPEFEKNLLNIYDTITGLIGTTSPDPPPLEELTIQTGTAPPFVTGTADHYKEITVISGKGGSGKTTVVASLAILADSLVLADNDVDAADLHLLLAPAVREVHDFTGGQKAILDMSACTGCGECEKTCHFDAIHSDKPGDDRGATTYWIDKIACEGCGLCEYVCEHAAIVMEPNSVGKWYVSNTNHGPMVHARLGIAEENSGKLVSQVRTTAAGLATALKMKRIIGDGPPGTGCPVIASISGTDRVLVVAEPTVSGVHDMQRVLKLTAHFGVASGIVINKADLNPEQAERIETIASDMGSRVIARIPFDRTVNDALNAGKTVIEYGRGPASEAIAGLWSTLQKDI